MKILLLLIATFFSVPSLASASLPSGSLAPDLFANTERAVVPWSLDQLDSESGSRDGLFRSQWTGSGVDLYMVDTGIGTHSELSGRVESGWSAWSGDGRTDCNGQGTATALLAAGSLSGVAPEATLYPVRALDCNGEADGSNIEAGLQWVLDHHVSGPAIVSVGGSVPLRTDMNQLISDLYAEGVLVVASAGDVFADVCTRSPGSAEEALAVGSVDSDLQRAIFSGFGSCLDLWAPGRHILVPEEGSVPVSRSGSALAAASAAGLGALLLQRSPLLSAEEVREGILGRAREGAVGDPVDSPNKLLFAADLSWYPGNWRYWGPRLVDPPEWSETSSETWEFEDGYFSDETRSGTWMRDTEIDGVLYNTELVCQVRDGSLVLRESRYSGAEEPSSCTISFGTIEDLEDGRYSFVVRKDLIADSGARILGRETAEPFELDRQGPQVSWGPVPVATNETILELPLRVYDRLPIDGLSNSDFVQEGTASCLLTPTAFSLPAGGGEIRVRALCDEEGTLRAALRAAAMYSGENGEKPGPVNTVRTPDIVIDWTAPSTSILSGPPESSISSSATISFSASEEGSFECRLDGSPWTTCSSPVSYTDLDLGMHSFEVRATDRAGNRDSTPAVWRWYRDQAPPSTEPPANDNFSAAEPIEMPGTWNASNRYATRQEGEPSHGQASVWYSFIPPTGGTLSLSTSGSQLDTILALYKGDSLLNLQRISYSDDTGPNLWSQISARIQGGEMYYISVAGAGSSRGSFTLRGSLGALGPSRATAQIRDVLRFPRKRMVRLILGVSGRQDGESVSLQCRQLRGSRVVRKWQTCSWRPLFRNLRRKVRHRFQVRVVADGVPESRPKTVAVRWR